MPTLQKNNFGELYTRASCEDGFSTIHFTDDSLTFFSKTKVGGELPHDWRSATKRWQYVHKKILASKLTKTKCPVCSLTCYFYQNEFGSRVYFDEIGGPWAKHPCTSLGVLTKSEKKIQRDSCKEHQNRKKMRNTRGMLSCPHCNSLVKKGNIDKHVAKCLKKIEQNRTVVCQYCNAVVQEIKLESHIASECLKSEAGIKRKEEKEKRQKIANEWTLCPYCHVKIRFKNLGNHVRKICPKNPAKRRA